MSYQKKINTIGTQPFKSGSYYPVSLRGVYTGTLTSAEARAYLFAVPYRTAFDRITVEVTTAGGASSVIRLGIYNVDIYGFPTTLVLDAGTVSSATTGVKSVTISQTLAAGLYALCGCVQGASAPDPIIRMVNPTILPPQTNGTTYIRGGFTQYSVTGAFGTYTATPGIDSGDMPFIQLRAT